MAVHIGAVPECLLFDRGAHRGENAPLGQALESKRYGVIAERDMFALAKLGADPKKKGLFGEVGVGARPPPGPRRSPSTRVHDE